MRVTRSSAGKGLRAGRDAGAVHGGALATVGLTGVGELVVASVRADREDVPSMGFGRVRVGARRRGGWEVVLPGDRVQVACETLDEARRVAFRYAARAVPCELVVHDAYNRVLDHELVDRAGSD
jgi:hypothetical protein